MNRGMLFDIMNVLCSLSHVAELICVVAKDRESLLHHKNRKTVLRRPLQF
jgi:hypothetical protein